MKSPDQVLKSLWTGKVEYRTIGEICEITRGRVISKEYLRENAGEYPVYSSQTYNNGIFGYINNYDYDCESITWTTDGANAGSVFYHINEKFSITNVCGLLRVIDRDRISTRFVYYCLRAVARDYVNYGMGNPKLMSNVMAKVKIPIPPMYLQKEIVRILGKLSEATEKLITDLNAELAARKIQYEYYRDKLLSFEGYETKLFGEIATIVRGASPRPIKKFITKDENGVNWIKIGDVQPGSKYITSTKEKITREGARKSRLVHPGDFVLSNSMSFGRPYIMKIEGCIHDGWLSISGFEKYYTPDFLYHLLSSGKIQRILNQRASNGIVKNLNVDIVESVELPLVPLEEQERIASLLDRYDAICNELSDCLTYEIEARRKQYEWAAGTVIKL